MVDPGTWVLAWRLAVAVVSIVAPTLAFVGLIHVLERLRDDDLVNRVLHEEEVGVEDTDDVLAVLAEGLDIDADADAEAGAIVRCPDCGARNRAAAGRCERCRTALS